MAAQMEGQVLLQGTFTYVACLRRVAATAAKSSAHLSRQAMSSTRYGEPSPSGSAPLGGFLLKLMAAEWLGIARSTRLPQAPRIRDRLVRLDLLAASRVSMSTEAHLLRRPDRQNGS